MLNTAEQALRRVTAHLRGLDARLARAAAANAGARAQEDRRHEVEARRQLRELERLAPAAVHARRR